MTLKRFSQGYATFGAWERGMPRTSRYAREIIRKHERFPALSLTELRNLRISDHDLSNVAWEALSPAGRRERILAAEVARGMRKGERLGPALARTGARKGDVLRHRGKTVYKSRNYWRVNKSDRIQIEMRFYERGVGHISIVTTNSKDRSSFLIDLNHLINIMLPLMKSNIPVRLVFWIVNILENRLSQTLEIVIAFLHLTQLIINEWPINSFLRIF